MKKISAILIGFALAFSSSQCTAQVVEAELVDPEVIAVQDGFAIGQQIDFTQILQETFGQVTKETKDKISKKIRGRAKEVVALRIEFIDQVCKLEPKQRKSLVLAGKGTIQKTLSKIFAKIPVKEEKDDDQKENANEKNVIKGIQVDGGVAGVQLIQGAAIGGDEIMFLVEDLMNSGQVFNLDRIPFWHKQVSRVLNKEQKELLAAENKKRRLKYRAAAVNYNVAVFSKDLLLNDDQQKKLAKLLDKNYGKVIDRNFGMDINYGNNLSSIILSRGDKDFLKLLTKTQQDILRRKMKMMGAFGGVGNFLGGVIDPNVIEDEAKDNEKIEEIQPPNGK